MDLLGPEPLPTPTPITFSSFQISNNFLSIATANTADTKDIGIYGVFTSSGTKYAVMYREASTSRFRVGITSTKPGDTVTGLTASDIEVKDAYLSNLYVNGLTTAKALACDSQKNYAINSNLPLSASYITGYITTTTNFAVTLNTWYRPSGLGLTLSAVSSADFSLSTAAANTGFKYTGPNAVVQIIMNLTAVDTKTYSAITTGAGTPAAPLTVTSTRAPNICLGRFDIASQYPGLACNNYITTINTNDEIAIFVASANSPMSLYMWNCSVNVLYYI